MNKAWVGVDVGKEFHWAHVLDASGRQLLSGKVENDEADILELIDQALSSAEEVVWAVDQPGGSAALLLVLLCRDSTPQEFAIQVGTPRRGSTQRINTMYTARNAMNHNQSGITPHLFLFSSNDW